MTRTECGSSTGKWHIELEIVMPDRCFPFSRAINNLVIHIDYSFHFTSRTTRASRTTNLKIGPLSTPVRCSQVL